MPVIFNLQWDGQRNFLPPKDTFNNMSWADISKVCKAGKASEYWNISDGKTFTVSNNDYIGTRAFTAYIIGFDHDTVSDAATYGKSTAGITLWIADTAGANVQMYSSNVNTYARNTIVNKTVLPSILSSIESELQNVIVPVKKKTANGNTTTPAYTSTESLFSLSYVECFGETDEDFCMEEGTRYKYFTMFSPYVGTNRPIYWLRSPSSDNNVSFGIIRSAFSDVTHTVATTKCDVSFAFCI